MAKGCKPRNRQRPDLRDKILHALRERKAPPRVDPAVQSGRKGPGMQRSNMLVTVAGYLGGLLVMNATLGLVILGFAALIG